MIIPCICVLSIILVIILYYLNKNALELSTNDSIPRNIFIYWDTGWDNNPKLPDVCRLCLKSWEKFNPSWNIIKLDQKNIYSYLSTELLSGIFTKKSRQVQSDLIRANLLSIHGGVWTDATNFCKKPLDNWLPGNLVNNYFIIRYDNTCRIGNWFIACSKDNKLMSKFTEKYNEYWKNKISETSYWSFHTTIVGMCRKGDNRFLNEKKINSARWRLTRLNPKDNTIEMSKPPSQELINRLNDNSIPMIKMSWKYSYKPAGAPPIIGYFYKWLNSQ